MKNRSNRVSLVLFFFLFGLVVCSGGVSTSFASELIYNSFNAAGTANGPTVDTVFTLTKPTTIAAITNYHWNNGAGQDPGLVNGWIGIEQLVSGADNVVVGRWPATGKPGAYGAPNTWWYAYPNTLLGPGTYKIVDSDSATWSYTGYSYYGYEDGPDWAAGKGFTQMFAAAGVTAISPADGANGIGSKQAVKITFSENVVPGPAWNSVEISYMKNSDYGPVKKVVPTSKSLSGNVLTLVPAEKYRENTLITVTLPAGSLMDNGMTPPGGTQPEPAYPTGAFRSNFSTSK